MYETWEECAAREVVEETGLRIRYPKRVHVTDDPMPSEGKHYVTIFMAAEVVEDGGNDVPKNLEPEKCEGWASYSLMDMQAVLEGDGKDVCLFGPLRKLIANPPKAVVDFFNGKK